MINTYEYGRALFELAEEQAAAEAILEELSAVELIIRDNPQYKTLLDTPAIASGEKPAMIDDAFACCHVYVRDFIKILATKRAIGDLGACLRVYRTSFSKACPRACLCRRASACTGS